MRFFSLTTVKPPSMFGSPKKGNYINIDHTGFMQMFGSAVMMDDMRVPVSSTKLGGVKDPTFGLIKDDGAGSQGVFSYKFSATQEQELFFMLQFSHDYAEGTSIEPHIHFVPMDDTAGDVIFGIEFTGANCYPATEAFPNTSILEVTTAVPINSGLDHLISDFDWQTQEGAKISKMMLCRIFRKATDEADTYAGEVGFLEIDFHTYRDSLGSRTEYIK